MSWRLVSLLMCVLHLGTVTCRPILDFNLEGINPRNNEHECTYPSTDEPLRPWEINQGRLRSADKPLFRPTYALQKQVFIYI